MFKKPVKFAVFNNKGGVGKSTVAVHIAHGLAIRGKKVLLMDLDGQNDASLFLGFTSEDYGNSLYEIPIGQDGVGLEDCIVHARDNLYLLPARYIERVNDNLYREPEISSFLGNKLCGLDKMGFDYVIVDCGPKRSKINDAALYFVDYIIVPVQVEAASVRAIGNIYEYLSDLGLDSDMIAMVIPNMYDRRTGEGRENLDFIRDFFADSGIVTDPIPRRIKIAESGKNGQTVYEYDNEVSKLFEGVVERLVEINGRKG